MPTITHVLVQAAEGRLVPIPQSEASIAGGVKPGKTYRVAWSSFTRRRITGGDLFLVNKGGTKVTDPKDADASGIKTNADGTIATDQRDDEVINAEATAAADVEAKKNPPTKSPAIADGKDR